MEKLPKKMSDELRKPLPPESISPHPTKKFLSTIKAIYVVERLNTVFGIGGWKVKNVAIKIEPKTKGSKVGDMVVVKSRLTIEEYGIEIESYGGNNNEDLGDAYKGACTDALTKIGSYLEIGIDVFKGKGSTPQVGTKSTNNSSSGNVCSVCGSTPAISYKKDPKGVEYCPNWKKHKADGVFGEIKPKPTKAEENFDQSLEESKDEVI